TGRLNPFPTTTHFMTSTDRNSPDPDTNPAAHPHHVVEGEITWLVRAVGLGIGTLLAVGIILGLIRGFAHAGGLLDGLTVGLLSAQVVFAGVLILLGSIVES